MIFKTNRADNFFWLLNIFCNLQQLKIPLRDFLNLVLVCNKYGPHRGCKFALFIDYIYVKKVHSVVFLIVCSKGYGDMTRIILQST